MTSVDCRDRTAEFFQVCEQKQKELTQPARPIVAKGKSQFMRDAGSIGNEIKSTSDKLQRLAKLAQRRSLFDDPADEINEMTAIIKQSITHLNSEVNDLKGRAAASNSGTTAQAQQHSNGVLNSLHLTLKKTTSEFMGVVKARRANVAEQEERKSQYGASSVPLRSNIFVPGSSLSRPAVAVGAPCSSSTPYSSGGLGDSFDNQQLATSYAPNNYLQDRADDVEQVETTIRELGSIFGELAVIVSEQGEMVERIDTNIEETEHNVSAAQNELFKYLNSISSNRMLVAKVFATLMMFAAIWVVFFV